MHIQVIQIEGAATMFKLNDVIMYGSQGVCEITAIEEKSIGGVRKRYFVLKPIKDHSATIYAPTDNANVLKKMRRLLTESEINNLIDSMPEEASPWISNVNERKEHFKDILASGNHSDLIQMIKGIYEQKTQREAEGKHLYISDVNFFKEAEQILYNEFQYVLKLNSKDDVMTYILHRLN